MNINLASPLFGCSIPGQYMCRLPYGTQDFLQRPHYCALISWTMKCSGSLLAICVAHRPTNQYTLMWLLVPLVSFPGHSSCVHNPTICGLVTCSDGLLSILIKDNKYNDMKQINQHNLTECVLNETSNQHKVHFVYSQIC